MQGLSRDTCVVCGDDNFQRVLTIPSFPVYMGCAESDSNDLDLAMDQDWVTCSFCNSLQLRNLVPLEILYQANHNDAIGPTWAAHASELASFLFDTEQPISILEIGAGDGKVARELINGKPNLEYTIVEPNFTGDRKGLLVIDGFVEEHLSRVHDADLIVHSHVLEHLYDPFDTMKLVAERMKTGSKMLVSFPNLEQILVSGGANALNFEHTYFASKLTLSRIFESLGLTPRRTKEFKHHSIFFLLEKTQERGEPVLQVDQAAVAQFVAFWDKTKHLVDRFNDIVNDNLGAETFCFGAHVFSQALIAKGIAESSLTGILDNSPRKIGSRLYGTNLRVLHPNRLSQSEEPIVALSASHFQEEIKSQLLLINPKTRIIEPQP